MGLLAGWRQRRVRRHFSQAGESCRFLGTHIEVKGRVELGDGCVIGGNVVLRTHKKGRIILEDGVEVADYALMQVNDTLRIGTQSYIGPHCVIRDTNHLMRGTDVHWRLSPHITQTITIGKHCFVAARCYLMPGVTLADGAVVAPGSIVTRDIPPLEIWAGAPAKLLCHRTDTERITKLKRSLDLGKLFGVVPPQEDPSSDTQEPG